MQRFAPKSRALISTLLIVMLSAAGLSATSSPANAMSIAPLTDENRIYTQGDTIDLDLSCQPDFVGEDGGNSTMQPGIQAPPGTTVDENLRMTGTLTTVGSFSIGFFRCYTDGNDTSTGWVNYYPGTIVVNAPVTPPPALQVNDLNTASCDVLVTAVLPQTPVAGSVKLVMNDNSIITFANVEKGELLSLELSLLNISQSSLINPKVASFSGLGDLCGTEVTYRLEYIYGNAPIGSTSKTLTVIANVPDPVDPFDPQVGDFSITAVKSSNGTCSINVSALVPDQARPVAIVLTAFGDTENDWISGVIINGLTATEGRIDTTISLASEAENTSNILNPDDRELIFTEPRACSGTYNVNIDSPAGILATTLINLDGAQLACNAGTILEQPSNTCTDVAKGFYTTQLNSSRAIACPKGMTTASKASKSVNDCYKPMVQTITSFKAPKAMKYGSVTNLPITTSTKAIAKYKVSGPCTAKVSNVVTKVKGKKVTTKMLKVTASKKAGNCSVTLTSVAKDKYLAMSKPVKIKVSKSGK